MQEHRAFMSFASHDDTYGNGKLSELCKRLSDEMRSQTGQQFAIFERGKTGFGQRIRRRVAEEINAATFFIAMLSPSFFTDEACREELALFLQRQQQLDRDDLVMPIYYIDPTARNQQDELFQAIADTRAVAGNDIRFEDLDSNVARRWIAETAAQICEVMATIEMSSTDHTGMQPNELLAQGVCAIIRDEETVGTGWLVSKAGHILTAGHVLGKDGPVEDVMVRFGDDVPHQAFTRNWSFQVYSGTDFAVLQLAEPVAREPLPINLTQSVEGAFRAMGYGINFSSRSAGVGRFLPPYERQDNAANRLFVLDSKQLSQQGYSGAPVYSDELQAVVALQIEATIADTGAGRDTVLAMPLYRIVPGFPQLAAFATATSNK
jgi:hypothetical protein